MWQFNFNDYLFYCKSANLKASNYKSLELFKKFLKEEEELNNE